MSESNPFEKSGFGQLNFIEKRCFRSLFYPELTLHRFSQTYSSISYRYNYNQGGGGGYPSYSPYGYGGGGATGGVPGNYGGGCTIDGSSAPCGIAMGMLNNGSAIPSSVAPYQNRPGFSFENHGLGIFTASWGEFVSQGGGPPLSPNEIRLSGYWVTRSASFSFGDAMSQQQNSTYSGGGGGGGQTGRNTGEKAVFSFDKLKDCLNQIGVTANKEDFNYQRGASDSEVVKFKLY